MRSKRTSRSMGVVERLNLPVSYALMRNNDVLLGVGDEHEREPALCPIHLTDRQTCPVHRDVPVEIGRKGSQLIRTNEVNRPGLIILKPRANAITLPTRGSKPCIPHTLASPPSDSLLPSLPFLHDVRQDRGRGFDLDPKRVALHGFAEYFPGLVHVPLHHVS